MLKSRALFPSSGFGNLTVGNSGSGNFCSSTAINGYDIIKITGIISFNVSYSNNFL